MLTRVALLVASLTASAVLALGLALMGVVPGNPAAAPGAIADPATATTDPAATDAAPAPITQIDTVYVVPTPVPTPDPTPPTIVIKKFVTASSGGEGGSEGDD